METRQLARRRVDATRFTRPCRPRWTAGPDRLMSAAPRSHSGSTERAAYPRWVPLGEMREGPRQGGAVDKDVELLVVKRNHPGDRRDLTQRIVVRPREVRMHSLADSDAPVLRGDSFIRTYGFGFACLQVRERDVGAVDVVAGRQSRLEKQDRAMCLGQHHAVEFDPDGAGRAQRVNTDIGVAGMTDDRFVLLDPVECIPFEPDAALDRTRVVQAGRRLPQSPNPRKRKKPRPDEQECL